jgi:hypothetical protein
MGDTETMHWYPKMAASYQFGEFAGLFDNLKLRFARGETGNMPNPSAKYNSMSSYNIGGVNGVMNSSTEGNPDIKPERTAETEFGVDFSVMSGLATVELSMYQQNISDLILLVDKAASSGASHAWENGGEMTTNGIELTLGLSPTKLVNMGGVDWNFQMTYYKNESEVTKLTVNPYNYGGFATFLGTYRIEEGWSPTSIVGSEMWYTDASGNQTTDSYTDTDGDGYHDEGPEDFTDSDGDGVWDHTDTDGDGIVDCGEAAEAWVDADGDGTWGDLNESHTQHTVNGIHQHMKLGDENPDYRVSFRNTFSFGPISLSFLIDHKEGGSAIDLVGLTYDLGGTTVDWEENGGTRLGGLGGVTQPYVRSTTYTALRDVSVTYTMPGSVSDRLGFGYLKVGLAARNWWLSTDYTGLSPEVSQFGNEAIGGSVDTGPFPLSKSVYLTLSVGI